jgi:hypothetical protein
MKFFALSALLILSCVVSLFAQAPIRRLETSATNIAVMDLQIESKNINQLLAKIAYKYEVPISLEVATNEDLLKGKNLKVQLKNGTLADVLNEIVKQKPSYTWEANERTVRVFPKTDYRDPLLQTLLEIRIAHFIIRKSTVKLNFREALTCSPELKDLLASYGVRPLNEGFSHSDFELFGGDFLLDLENMSVRSILDSVVQTSKTKYWFIKRDEEDKTFFLINF